jgi:hypothetical protein
MKFSITVGVLIAGLLLAGCGSGGGVKKHPDADSAREALRVVDTFFEAFSAGRNADTAQAWAGDGAVPEIGDSLTVRYEIEPRLIEIDGTDTRITVAWSAQWSGSQGEQSSAGTAVFTVKGTPLRIEGVSGDNPFAPPTELTGGGAPDTAP